MKTADECVGYFGVDAERGLSQRQVEENRKKYGPNGELLSQYLIFSGFERLPFLATTNFRPIWGAAL